MSASADHADLSAIASPLGMLRIRPERPEDEAFRVALFGQSRPDMAMLPEAVRDGIMQMQFRAQTASYRAQFPQACHDIVELEGEPIGRIVRDYSEGVLHLVDIALLPSRRGGGAGAALMRALMADAAAAGIAMRLMVSSNNPAAARLYLRLGFVPVGQAGVDSILEWRAATL